MSLEFLDLKPGPKRGRPKGTTKGGMTHALTPAQQDALFAAARARGIRDEFFLKLVYTLALRCKEAIELRLDDFNDKTKEVLVRAVKGGTHRHYLLFAELWALYKLWMKERAETTPASNPWLFPHRVRRADDRLTSEGAKSLFYTVAKAAGIKGHSIHSLRHSIATDMALAGDSQLVIARHLRHKSVQSSARYISTVDDGAHQAVLNARLQRRWGKR